MFTSWIQKGSVFEGPQNQREKQLGKMPRVISNYQMKQRGCGRSTEGNSALNSKKSATESTLQFAPALHLYLCKGNLQILCTLEYLTFKRTVYPRNEPTCQVLMCSVQVSTIIWKGFWRYIFLFQLSVWSRIFFTYTWTKITFCNTLKEADMRI